MRETGRSGHTLVAGGESHGGGLRKGAELFVSRVGFLLLLPGVMLNLLMFTMRSFRSGP